MKGVIKKNYSIIIYIYQNQIYQANYNNYNVVAKRRFLQAKACCKQTMFLSHNNVLIVSSIYIL